PPTAGRKTRLTPIGQWNRVRGSIQWIGRSGDGRTLTADRKCSIVACFAGETEASRRCAMEHSPYSSNETLPTFMEEGTNFTSRKCARNRVHTQEYQIRLL
ncbi:unnamed protein product, partial [Ectocarpus sp. 12 AP-2014]